MYIYRSLQLLVCAYITSPSAELDRITFAEEMARFAWNYLIVTGKVWWLLMSMIPFIV